MERKSGAMAIHGNLWTMAVAVIDENLIASHMCLECRRLDGGCLGYPATLLLLCVVNALGTFLTGESVMIENKSHKITRGEPFRVLNHDCLGFTLSHKEIKLVEDSYRNRLAHNAIIEVGASLLPSNEEPPFVFDSDKVGIRVFSFYRLVCLAWQRFPKESIETWEDRRTTPKVGSPVPNRR
jgi:hypothetical protein